MRNKPPSKDELRKQLERQTRRFLDRGGKVNQVPRGATGSDPMKSGNFQSSSLFTQPRSNRTLIPEVVAAIEARRREKIKRRPVRRRSRLPQPRRRVIYDDFGEAIRKVWVDD